MIVIIHSLLDKLRSYNFKRTSSLCRFLRHADKCPNTAGPSMVLTLCKFSSKVEQYIILVK